MNKLRCPMRIARAAPIAWSIVAPLSKTQRSGASAIAALSTAPPSPHRIYTRHKNKGFNVQGLSGRTFSTTRAVAAATRYPSREEVARRFQQLQNGEYDKFFAHVSDDVDWTVMAHKGTHPCAGRYTSLATFQQYTLQRLGAIMKPPGLTLKLRNVIGGGDDPWAVAELVADAECKNGLDFDVTYAWCLRHDEQGKIVQVRAYLDSTLVKRAVEENECPSHRAPTGIS